MLNKYDFKYILKRVIVFLTIGLIMSFIGSCRVRAYGSTTWIQTAPLGYECDIAHRGVWCSVDNLNKFSNYGIGEVVFSMSTETDQSYSSSGRSLRGIQIIDSGSHVFECDIGNNATWFDNAKYIQTYTAKCPVDLRSTFLSSIRVEGSDGNNNTIVYIHFSDYITFIRDDGSSVDNQGIINAITNVYNQALITNDRIQHNNYQNDYILAKLEEIRLALANNQDLKEINDAIQSDNIDNNAVTDNTQGWEQQTSYVPTGSSGGSITDLLTLPIKLIQGFVNGLNSSCVPFSLGTLFDTQLILPCINISSYIGMPLWTTIDILFSGFMILHIGKKFVKIFNDFTNLRSNQMDDLYGGGN